MSDGQGFRRSTDGRGLGGSATAAPLDNPFWHALVGELAHLAEGDGRARRFQPAVNVFAALPDMPRAGDWCALRDLLGPQGRAIVARARLDVPSGWTVEYRRASVQLLAEAPLDLLVDQPTATGDEFGPVEDLGTADAAEMLALAERSKPGPFTLRTVDQGGFRGVRTQQGQLVAMAGTRCRVPGAVEISSVCTDPVARGRGLATLLVRDLGHRIQRSGRRVFLHTAADNVAALAVYRRLGFVVSGRPDFVTLRPPAGSHHHAGYGGASAALAPAVH